MSNLISSANFIGDIMLPNVVGTGAQAAQLTTFITKHEPRYLKDILGIQFYELFLAGLLEEDTNYMEIRDGATFTDSDGVLREWLGLDNVGTSPIANFVFYQTMRYNVSQTNSNGESMSAVENGTRATPTPKMVEAWNQMVEWNKTLHEYLYVNRVLFPTYIGIDNPPSKYNEEVNQYLFEPINNWGI